MPSCQILQQPGYAHSPAAQSQDDHVQGTTSFLTDEHGFRSLDFRGNEISFPILFQSRALRCLLRLCRLWAGSVKYLPEGTSQLLTQDGHTVRMSFRHRFPTRGMSSFPSFIETWIYVDTMVSHIPGNRLSPANKTIKNRRIDT